MPQKKKAKKISSNKKIVNKKTVVLRETKGAYYDSHKKIDIKRTKIRVIGIGGGGGSIVSELANKVKKATFVVANTDTQALKSVGKKVIKFQFGQALTQGLGTGMKSEVAEIAAQGEKEKIKKLIGDNDLCIFVVSLGGGTGSGAIPTFAKIAKNSGCISYGIFTLPFKFEGEKKLQIAIDTLEKLKQNLNAISVIPNDRIFHLVDRNTPLKIALSAINKNLAETLEALLETIYEPGLINIDFADLRTVFEGRGRLTYLNSVQVSALDKSEELVKKVLYSPLYPYNIKGARGVLFNITSGSNLELSEVHKISGAVLDSVNKKAKIVLGIGQKAVSDSKQNAQEGKIRVTLLATGCGQKIFSEKAKTQKTALKKVKKTSVPKNKKSKKSNETKSNAIPIKKISEQSTRRESAPTEIVEQNKLADRLRRNALEIKRDIEAEEKEIIDQESRWELPAFLRKKDKNENDQSRS